MKQRLRSMEEQQGVVAIFSVLIIMGILTLLTIGFTSMTNDSQRRALDDHLSTQAYYAAESGVNIAKNWIGDGIGRQRIDECQELLTVESDPTFLNVESNQGISVSCLLINPTPQDLVYNYVPYIGDAPENRPVVGNIETADGVTTTSSLVFEWDTVRDGYGIDPPGSYPNLPSSGVGGTQWGQNVGMLRVDLVQGFSPDSRSNVVSDLYSFYLYPGDAPANSTVTTSPGVTNHGQMYNASCSNPVGPGPSQENVYRCRLIVDLAGVPQVVYKIRLTSYYNPSRVRVVARDALGNASALKHGQAEIDSTGKAGDVLRRINVRIPMSEVAVGVHEPFAIFGGASVCKQYSVGVNLYSNESGVSSCNL